MSHRPDILREINFVWEEIWNGDDLPGSMFEITLKGSEDRMPRITMPYFVGKLRGVKDSSRNRIELQTPRPFYQDETYLTSPYTWRILGESPLPRSIENATRLTFTLTKPSPVPFKISVIGTDDRASEVRDQITMLAGAKSISTTRQFTDATSIIKDTLLEEDIVITGANGEDYGIIPNLQYGAVHQLVQVADRCVTCCVTCRCFDIAYKRIPTVFYYDEQIVPYPEVLMTKAMEWILLPKDGQEQKAALFGTKSAGLLTNRNADDSGVSHKLDVSVDRMNSWTGFGYGKI